ncbi:hypothetical protein HFP89_11900 [Wenzhouxiangella sp. XN79A]|uniref:hypothetical protein n=1 Tax=Wenzhouxiangella sp. XN79A TaxID=2724193 RepID=UPI00144AD555|nr:hypothetical protein [Wenzhouxiangella sp. XN79A]NKI35866.1 hypothetical protein [Wenzhouxiangella sp. XN79A]
MMFRDFQLAAIVGKGANARLLRVPMHQALQETLAESWCGQYETFLRGIQEIDFDAGYQAEEHERFRLEDYELPGYIAEQDGASIAELDAITNDEQSLDITRGLVAFVRTDEGDNLLLFQNFSRSHVIRPGRFLFLQRNTYETTQRPGLTLADKLSAVFLSDEQKLLFHNFRTVNSFLPLAEFYSEASEQQIREVLQHELFEPEDLDALAVDAPQWFRKRFAMLKDSGVLDDYSANQIRERSAGYEIIIQVRNGRIVFPAERPEAKKLLQFLNEELFRGAITETLYETNSKREAD